MRGWSCLVAFRSPCPLRIAYVYLGLTCVWCEVSGHKQESSCHRESFAHVKCTRYIKSVRFLPDTEKSCDCEDRNDVDYPDDSECQNVLVVEHFKTSRMTRIKRRRVLLFLFRRVGKSSRMSEYEYNCKRARNDSCGS